MKIWMICTEQATVGRGTFHCDVASRPKDQERSMQFKLEIIRVSNGFIDAV